MMEFLNSTEKYRDACGGSPGKKSRALPLVEVSNCQKAIAALFWWFGAATCVGQGSLGFYGIGLGVLFTFMCGMAIMWRAAPPRMSSPKLIDAGAVLFRFRWLCDATTRDLVDLALNDIKKDVREMESQGFGPGWIYVVRFWKTCRCIVPIIWDGFKRVLESAFPVVELIKKFKPLS